MKEEESYSSSKRNNKKPVHSFCNKQITDTSFSKEELDYPTKKAIIKSNYLLVSWVKVNSTGILIFAFLTVLLMEYLNY